MKSKLMYASPVFLGVALILFWLTLPFYIVKPGKTAIHLRLGRLAYIHREPGFHLKVPGLDSIVSIPTTIQKTHIETTALSKDLQAIEIGVTINYRYINEWELYKSTQVDTEEVIIIPFCHETIKSIVALYTAEELIHNRHEAKDRIHHDMVKRLKPHFIDFIEVNFSHADFSPAFIKAVESKQIAVQEAMRSKNVTESIKEAAAQERIRAETEAYAQQTKKDSINENILKMRTIEKWDGKLPLLMSSSSTPFLDISSVMGKK